MTRMLTRTLATIAATLLLPCAVIAQVPNTFGTQSGKVPASQLDDNFSYLFSQAQQALRAINTYYASNTSTNGMSVGSDSNAGISPAAPFLTLTKAMSAVPPGAQIVLNCGTYAPVSGSFTASNSVTISGVKAQSMTSENCVVIQGGLVVAGNGVVVNLKDVALDGGGSAPWALHLNASVARNAVNLTNVLFANLGADGVDTDSGVNTDFSVKNSGVTGSFSGSLYNGSSWGAGSLAVHGIVSSNVTSSSLTTNGVLLHFVATAPGVPATVSNVVGNVTFSPSATVQSNAIKILNAQPATVTDMGVPYGQHDHDDPNPLHWTWGGWFETFGTGGGAGGCNPVLVSVLSSNIIQSDNLSFVRNWTVNDCTEGGHTSILVNSDGDPGASQRNTLNNSVITNDRETTGPDVTPASTPEGFLPGWVTNPRVADTVTENWPGVFNGPFGPIAKGVTGGLYYGNLVINPGHTGMQLKGGSEISGGVGPAFWNNTILWNLTPTSPTTVQGFSETVDESFFPVAGFTIGNNNIVNLAGSNLTVRYNAVTQGSCVTSCDFTGTYTNNNWFGPFVGPSLQAWDASRQAVDSYTSLSAWQAGGTCSGAVGCPAVEPTATGVDPALQYYFTPSAGSPMIAGGTAPPTGINGATDLAGNLIVSPYTVGSLQYRGPNDASAVVSTAATYTWSASQLFSGTTFPAIGSGQIAIGGGATLPTLGAAGEAAIFLSTTNGLSLIGNGSNFDFRFYDHTGAAIMAGSALGVTLNKPLIVTTATGIQQTGLTTVSALGACNSTAEGTTKIVTDASSPSWGTVLSGAGTTTTKAFCNGTSWVAD